VKANILCRALNCKSSIIYIYRVGQKKVAPAVYGRLRPEFMTNISIICMVETTLNSCCSMQAEYQLAIRINNDVIDDVICYADDLANNNCDNKFKRV